MIELNAKQVELTQYPAGEYRMTQFIAGLVRDENALAVRGASPDDLVQAALIAHACRRQQSRVKLFVPYLPAARDDRDFMGCSVYSRLINAIEADEVHCFDPHSSVMPSHIDRCIVHSCTEAVVSVFRNRVAGVIAPDAGARSRAHECAQALNVPVFHAAKKRDQVTGALSGFECEPLPQNGTLLIVDDICDGGGTFIGLAKVLGLPRERLALWVSHGVFSGQALSLHEHFSSICTTDSLSSSNMDGVKTINVLDFMR